MQKIEDFRITLHNLFILNKYNILNNNSILLYSFYLSMLGKCCSLSQIKKHLKISYLMIVSCNSVLQYLHLVSLKKEKGKTSIVESVYTLSTEKLQKILKSKVVIDHIVELRNNTFNKYFTKSLNLSSTEQRMESKELDLLLSMLPSYCRSFKVTSKFLLDLKSLVKRVDLKQYTEWFIDRKIKTEIISGFSLSIFMYPTMITEYETVKDNYKTEQRRKKTTSGLKDLDTSKLDKDLVYIRSKKRGGIK